MQSDLLKLILDDDRFDERSVVRRRASKIIDTGGRSPQFRIAQYRNSYVLLMSEILKKNFSSSLGFLSKKSRVRLLKEYCASPPPSRHFLELILQFPGFVSKSTFGVVRPSDNQLLRSLLQLDLAVFELSAGCFPSASEQSRILHFDSPILDLWLNLRSRKPRQKRSLQEKPETLRVWISADRDILFERTSE